MAQGRPSAPDQNGRLVVPTSLHLHPAATPRAALDEWASYAGRPVAWAHASVETRERRPRVERLLGPTRIADYTEWLEALVVDRSAAASIAALRTLGKCLSSLTLNRRDEEAAKRARIVLTADGALVAPDPHALFARDGSAPSERAVFVDETVISDTGAAKVLADLGIGVVDASADYALYLDTVKWNYDDWDQFWQKTSLVDPNRAAELIKSRQGLCWRIRIKTVAGTWEPRANVLLPGLVVPGDGSRDGMATVDVHYHHDVLETLERLGVRAAPALGGFLGRDEGWLAEYYEECLAIYAEATRDLRQHPDQNYLVPDRLPSYGPLEPLRHLSDEGRARFTSAVLSTEPDGQDWKIRHSTVAAYPQVRVPEPVTWCLEREGRLSTSRGIRPTRGCVSHELAPHDEFLPVADCRDAWASRFSLPTRLSEVTASIWAEAFAACCESGDVARVGAFYAAACAEVEVPDVLRCHVGPGLECRAADEIAATGSRDEYEDLSDANVPVLLCPSRQDAERLATRWGLRLATGAVETRVDAVPIAERLPLVDEFPPLRFHLRRQNAQLLLVRCSELRRETVTPSGRQTRNQEFVVDDGRVYWLDDGDELGLLERLNDALSLGLAVDDLADVAANREDSRRRDLVEAIRAVADPAGKLLRAVGAEAIRRHLRPALLDGVEETVGELDDAASAELAHSVFGIDLFAEFRRDLDRVGLQPPTQWAGSRSARRFVAQLGLPREFAGFETARYDALWEVDGPIELPPLHGFQSTITGNIRSLLRSEDGKRGLLSLPTGAGKTRVTVESLVRAVVDGELGGPILWIAPTTELCEQAVQTWADIWRSGPRRPAPLEPAVD